MENIPITPLADRVLIKPIEAEESTYGNIVVPDMGKDRPDFGTVLAVGPGLMDDSGQRIKMQVEVGDVVIIDQFSGQEIDVEGDKIIFARESACVAIMSKK